MEPVPAQPYEHDAVDGGRQEECRDDEPVEGFQLRREGPFQHDGDAGDEDSRAYNQQGVADDPDCGAGLHGTAITEEHKKIMPRDEPGEGVFLVDLQA